MQRPEFLPVAEPDLGALEEQYLLDAFRSGWISSLGTYIERFESSFSNFCGAAHGVALSNGTNSLHLALVVAGVGPGDEVIVPSLTFVATAAAVRHTGATPVFADSEPDIGTMDPQCVASALSKRTKAIVPVHVYGHPVDMDPIMMLAGKRSIPVIEDAAEAHGATYKGRRVGAIGDMGVFSFYGNKLLTTGEGGMLVTNNDVYARRAHFLRDHAMDPERRYWHPEVGFNYRMTNLQAAIGCAQLERWGEIINRRRKLLETYRVAFSQIPHVKLNPSRQWAEPVPWVVSAILPDGKTSTQRDTISNNLKNLNIDTRPYFIPLNNLPPYQGCKCFGSNGNGVPVATDLSNRGLNLPSAPSLTDEDVERVFLGFSATKL